MSFRPEFLSNSVQGDKAIMAGYARYFKKELLSDCNIVISWPAEDDSSSGPHRSKDGDGMPRSSRTFPGHQIVLIKSSIFEAQVTRGAARETAVAVQYANHASNSTVVIVHERSFM